MRFLLSLVALSLGFMAFTIYGALLVLRYVIVTMFDWFCKKLSFSSKNKEKT
jgi:hypothetical protein